MFSTTVAMKVNIIKSIRGLAALILALVLVLVPLSAKGANLSARQLINDGTSDLSAMDFSGQNLAELEISNMNLTQTNLSNTDLRNMVITDSTITDANLQGADFSYSIAYKVNFKGADLSDAVLVEAILLGSRLDDVNITGTDFSDAVLDRLQVQNLCTRASGVNSKTGVETRESLGCR